MLTPEQKAQLTSKLLRIAQELYLKGITPTVASIKAKAGGEIPLPCIIEAMTMWNQMDKSHLNKLKLEGVTALEDESADEEQVPDFAIMGESKEKPGSQADDAQDPQEGIGAALAQTNRLLEAIHQDEVQTQGLLKEMNSKLDLIAKGLAGLNQKLSDSKDPQGRHS